METITPQLPDNSSSSKKSRMVVNKLGEITENPINIRHDISTIEFDEEKNSTYYLLFCSNLNEYEEIAKNSHRMILMNAIYPSLGNIIRDFDFIGIVCHRHLVQDLPIMFGLKSVIKEIDDIHNHPPLIKSKKYDSIFKRGFTTLDLIQEYLLLYDTNRQLLSS